MNGARARVRVVLEIDAGGCWGDDCDMAQIRKQASESAVARLHEISHAETDMKILNTVVTAVLVCEESR